MKKIIKCQCCNGGKRPMTYPHGGHCICPYCQDTGSREIDVVDKTHKMGKKSSQIMSPNGGEPRLYTVRVCKKCGREEWLAAAGKFFNGLLQPCGVSVLPTVYSTSRKESV
jgi:hypothetical protein